MSIQFESLPEAYAAVAIIVMGADGITTIGPEGERHVLFEHFRQLDVFKAYSDVEFSELLTIVVNQLVPLGLGMGIPENSENFKNVLLSINSTVSPEERKKLLDKAQELSLVDGITKEEEIVLNQIAQGLDVA